VTLPPIPIAHRVEGSGFVGDGGAVLAGVERLKITRQAVTVLLLTEAVKQRTANLAVDRERSRAVKVEAALSQSLHD